jgi:hypothetical protein
MQFKLSPTEEKNNREAESKSHLTVIPSLTHRYNREDKESPWESNQTNSKYLHILLTIIFDNLELWCLEAINANQSNLQESVLRATNKSAKMPNIPSTVGYLFGFLSILTSAPETTDFISKFDHKNLADSCMSFIFLRNSIIVSNWSH